jgi:SAM-dependent methyltransferase
VLPNLQVFAEPDAWWAEVAAISPSECPGRDQVIAGASGWLEGFCTVCAATSQFHLQPLDGGAHGDTPSLRESLACIRCRANARQRAAVAVLRDALTGLQGEVYLTEQASPLYLALRRNSWRLHGSEYGIGPLQRLRLTAWLWRHGAFALVRQRDVTTLDFRDASIDAVLTLDVLEHVPDYRQAIGEFARILRPGGSCVLTVPFHDDCRDHSLRARVGADGRVEHLLAPQYHGDPLGGGVLCFHDFGWALLDDLRSAGFETAEAVRLQGMDCGWPEAIWVLRARR